MPPDPLPGPPSGVDVGANVGEGADAADTVDDEDGAVGAAEGAGAEAEAEALPLLTIADAQPI